MSGYGYAGANPLREVDPEGMQRRLATTFDVQPSIDEPDGLAGGPMGAIGTRISVEAIQQALGELQEALFGGDGVSAAIPARQGAASSAQMVGSREPTVRIRHYTNASGLSGIERDGVIQARDRGSVFAEPASRKPLSPREAETKYQLHKGHGRNYVETDVPVSRVAIEYNTRTQANEIRIRGSVPLINPRFVRR